MNKPLIELKDSRAAFSSIGPTAEAAFIVAGNPDLFLAGNSQEQQLAYYLDHSITRNPLDLRAHTQRIYLCLASKDHQGVYAALLDLFIALGANGRSLRRHLLEQCKRALSRRQRKLFQSHLEIGIHASTALADAQNSLLHQGLESNLPLISKAQNMAPLVDTQPLAEAREYLEYGQLEAALHTLETAMLNDPADSSLREELLQIYAHARLIDRYHAHSQAMTTAGHSLAHEWLVAEERIS